MSSLYLQNGISTIQVGDVVLQGFTKMDITCLAKFEEKSIAGKSGKSRRPAGYEDDIFTLHFTLLKEIRSRWI